MGTYRENAENFELWREAVDPGATMTRSEFEQMTVEEKVQIQVDCFGPEEKSIPMEPDYFRNSRDRHIAKLTRQLERLPGGANPQRVQLIKQTVDGFDNPMDIIATGLEVCSDEHTGNRYGRAKCRVGRCVKIGSGGRNKDQTGYQIWLVWNR